MNDSIEQFFTREDANTGVKMFLDLPGGKPSGHHLVLMGCDSDSFRAANDAAYRELALMDKEVITAQDHDNAQLKALSSLIKSWSMDVECNETNKTLLLRESPTIRDQINIEAAKQELFIKKE